MTSPIRPRRAAVTLLSVALAAMGLVLGLWQQVERSCLDGRTDDTDPLASCEPIRSADVDQVPTVHLEQRTAEAAVGR